MNKRRVQLFGLALCSLFVAGAAGATTITVQNTGDGPANAANCPGAGGTCRLRDAIAAANDGDTINLICLQTAILPRQPAGVRFIASAPAY